MNFETNILIAYFSRTGHTKTIAEQIESKVGGELFEILTVNPYPADYEYCVDVAKVEYETDARPKLLTNVRNMEDYDVIFLGFPDWCSHCERNVCFKHGCYSVATGSE